MIKFLFRVRAASKRSLSRGRAGWGAALLILFSATGLSCRHRPAGNEVCYNRVCYQVEIASTPETRTRGLQFRTEMARDHGMLFVFSENRPHAFWMKDTLIPLDMIWMDYGHRVVHIERNVPPCHSDPCPVYRPDQDATYVLELNAGQADRWGLKRGSRVEFYIAR
jgi:hypothetical protein